MESGARVAELERLIRRKIELEAELASISSQIAGALGGKPPATSPGSGRDGLAARVRAAFADGKVHSSKEIATVLKEPQGRVGDALKRLARSKALRRVRPGVFRRA